MADRESLSGHRVEETGRLASYQDAAGLQVTSARLTGRPFGIYIPNGPGAWPPAAGIVEADATMITRLPLAALIIASLFWGTAVSVTKYALRGFGPVTLLAISLIAGTAVLWTIVILRGHRPPPPWRRVVLLGLFEPALAYAGDLLGLARTSAANGAAIRSGIGLRRPAGSRFPARTHHWPHRRGARPRTGRRRDPRRHGIVHRAARLGPKARQTIEAAALIGDTVDERLLRDVVARPALAEVIASGLVVGHPVLRFRHEIARQAIEQAVLPARRSELHARIPQRLRTLGCDDDARLAFHAEEAGDGPAALQHAASAGRHARSLASHREAAVQLTGNHRGASELFDALGCPYDAALALLDAPDELALRRALDVCNALGAVATARIIRQKMRSRGFRSVPAGQRAATRENPLGLTQREQEVLELLCEGRTNAGIATKLVISPKTVDHHVSSVLTKLGVSKRTEVTAAAKRAAATPK